MRILFCNKYNFPFSGTEAYLFELMDLLRAHGHEVALFSMQDSRGQPTPYDQYCLPHIDFKDPSLGLWARAKLAVHAVYSMESRRRLRAMIAEFQPDIAHVRNIYHHLSPSILWELKAHGIPVLYHLNDFKILCPAYNLVTKGHACEHPCRGKYWKVFTQGCYTGSRAWAIVLAVEAFVHHCLGTYRKCVDHLLAPSQFVKDMLIENGFDSQTITVLPHFQVPSQATPTPEPGHEAPVLYFGRLSSEKGVTDLVHAMKTLPQTRLQIAGDGPQKTELQALTHSLGLKNVEFVGHVTGKALTGLIASSRFTVLPSRAYETLGKSILESYAEGKPVVASDLGSRRELVHERATGLLFPAGNVEQLREAISYLAQRPQLATDMGVAGRQLVQVQHSPEDHYQQLMGLYQQMTALAHSRQEPHTRANKTALRVAFIGGRGVASKYSGIETYYEEAGRHLVEQGYEVTAYCRSYFTPPMTDYQGMRVVRIPTIRSKHLETFVHTLLSTLHAIFRSHDIVHYHAQGSALFSSLPRLVGKKTVVTVQGLDWQRKKWGRFASFILQLAERASVRLPNATMVVSRTLQKYHRTRYGADTRYVPNGGRLRDHRPARQLLEWGLAPDNYVLFLGRLSPEKNCHLLIDAYEQIATSAKLVFAGGSSYTDQYAKQLHQRGTDRIVFLDWVSGDALDELLTNAALFVLPSDLEGLSLALLDAMGAGVCVLTSDIAENSEVVDGVGFTFHAGDVNDLSRMLHMLLSDKASRTTAGRSAKQRVAERYLWPQIAKQVGAIYEELTGYPNQPAKRPSTNIPADATAEPSGRVA